MAVGYIYILLNPSLRSQRYKIGMTRKTPEERASAISSATGVPEPFEVAYAKKVRDCQLAERLIMDRLHERRISSNREFFDIALQEAVETLNDVAAQVGIVEDESANETAQTSTATAVAGQPRAENHTNLEDSEITIHVPPKRSGRKAASKKRGRRTIEEHLQVCEPNIRDLFEKFRERVKAIDPLIQENPWSYGLAYRAKQNFVEMYFRTNRLEVCLRPIQYSDPENLLGKVPDKYKWTLNRRFLLEDESQIEYLVSLVRQSYENVS